jgi:quercetin dioxygenase-like cupin family protein
MKMSRKAFRIFMVVRRADSGAEVMIPSMRTIVIASLLVATIVSAQQTPPKTDAPIGITPEAVVWTDGPPTLPPGSKMAVLEGSPRAEGMFTMRVRVPAGSAIPPHWHPRQERVTILSGAVDLGFGAVANKNSVTRYRAGSFYVNPPRVMHYLFFPEATEMQMTGVGPWELFTTDPNAPPAVPTATVTVHDIAPSAGSDLAAATTFKAEVDYEIHTFRPSTNYLQIVFETTTLNQTFSMPSAAPKFLDIATGTVTMTQDLRHVLTQPSLKHPIRLRVYVQEQRSERSSHVAGMSDWILFR